MNVKAWLRGVCVWRALSLWQNLKCLFDIDFGLWRFAHFHPE